MENQPIVNSSETTPINSVPGSQPPIPAQTKTKTSLLIPILSTVLVSAVVFGFSGYYFGARTVVPQQYVNYNQPVPTNSSEMTLIQPSSTPDIANPSPGDKETGVFKNSKIGIEFKYSTDLILDPNQSPRFYNDDPLNRWIVVLKTKTGNDEIMIQSGGPADWGDCKKRLDEKTITGDVILNYFKETLSNESYCAGGEKYIGWYATATKGNNSWFISLSTKNTDLKNQQFLEPIFLDLIKSFKTI